MMIRNLYWLSVTSLLLLQASRLQGQDQPFTGRAALFTDREMYIAGERIMFSAYAYDSTHNEPLTDKVLYLELITPDGFTVKAGKYPIDSGRSQGCLEIPEETLSGYYYMKCYSRYMRNIGPGIYTYQRIIIIHPEKKEVLSGKRDTAAHVMEAPISGADASYGIAPVKTAYRTNDTVRFTVSGQRQAGAAPLLCLSVVLEGAANDQSLTVRATKRNDFEHEGFIMETRGVSLSGRLEDTLTNEPIPGTLINLSIIGRKEMIPVLTDTAGRFFFSLPPLTGNYDLFLGTGTLPGTAPQILIDNDFCPLSVSLPAPDFRPDESRKTAALEMAINFRLNQLSETSDVTGQAERSGPSGSFYGTPTQVLRIDKYIELPSLEEYFNELPVEAKVRQSQGRKRFRFASAQPEMLIFDPLVMIDWVALDDVEKVLSAPPRNIDRIELVNAPYVKGNVMFGGVISFISKNNDFAGIDLPASGTFISYRFFEECSLPSKPEAREASWPAAQNTLLWIPDLGQIPEQGLEYSFQAPDVPGAYVILLQGLGSDGEPLRIARLIEIFSQD